MYRRVSSVLVGLLLGGAGAASHASPSEAFIIPSSTSSSSIRRRGHIECKKGGSSGSSGGGGAAKGFGFMKKAKADSYKYTGRLKPGDVGSSRLVPADIMRPDYALDG